MGMSEKKTNLNCRSWGMPYTWVRLILGWLRLALTPGSLKFLPWVGPFSLRLTTTKANFPPCLMSDHRADHHWSPVTLHCSRLREQYRLTEQNGHAVQKATSLSFLPAGTRDTTHRWKEHNNKTWQWRCLSKDWMLFVLSFRGGRESLDGVHQQQTNRSRFLWPWWGPLPENRGSVAAEPIRGRYSPDIQSEARWRGFAPLYSTATHAQCDHPGTCAWRHHPLSPATRLRIGHPERPRDPGGSHFPQHITPGHEQWGGNFPLNLQPEPDFSHGQSHDGELQELWIHCKWFETDHRWHLWCILGMPPHPVEASACGMDPGPPGWVWPIPGLPDQWWHPGNLPQGPDWDWRQHHGRQAGLCVCHQTAGLQANQINLHR